MTRYASLYDEDGFLQLREGAFVTRCGEWGRVGHIVNWHWANVTWTRKDGSSYVECSYLPDCQKLAVVKLAA